MPALGITQMVEVMKGAVPALGKTQMVESLLLSPLSIYISELCLMQARPLGPFHGPFHLLVRFFFGGSLSII